MGRSDIALPWWCARSGTPGLADAMSPYGYPGAAVRGAAGAPADPADRLVATGLVSVFFASVWAAIPRWRARRPLGRPGARPLAGARLRSRFAEQIRRNAKARVPGRGDCLGRRPPPSSGRASTRLHRDDAPSERGRALFLRSRLLRRGCSASSVPGLSSAGAPRGDGGGGDRGPLRWAPPLLPGRYRRGPLVDVPVQERRRGDDRSGRSARVPAESRGGVRPGDGLEDFKRGFANAELPFRTHEIVCDPEPTEARRGPRVTRLLPPLPRSPEVIAPPWTYSAAPVALRRPRPCSRSGPWLFTSSDICWPMGTRRGRRSTEPGACLPVRTSAGC